jgi:hypothetical protein
VRRATAPEALVFWIAFAGVLTVLSPVCWLVLVTDGGVVAGVLLGAAGWGMLVVRGLRAEALLPYGAGVVGVALGLGVLSLAALGLGLAGLLNRFTGAALVILGIALLVLRVTQRGRVARDGAAGNGAWGEGAARGLVILPLAWMLAQAAFAACLPPGALWREEGFGYDVLEYHLQAPREYFAAGAIHFLPHNVYASFPQVLETLYLLLMHLLGGPYRAAIACQLLHLSCGVLAVLLAGACVAPGWRRCGVWLLVGSIPWLAYAGCLAYVENGLLLYAMTAGVTVRAVMAAPPAAGVRGMVLAGLAAGLAGGCKYTGLVLAAAAVGAAWLIAGPGGVRRRAVLAAVFGFAVLAAFGPWLVRNAVWTGNPVYPFAYGVFGGAAWSAEQDEQWRRGHALRPGESSAGARLERAWREFAGSWYFGAAAAGAGGGRRFTLPAPIVLLAVVALVAARARGTLFAGVWLGLALGAWAGLTHMPGRFLVVAIAPLALLLVELAIRTSRRGLVAAFVAIGFASAAWNGVAFARELSAHAPGRDVRLAELVGQTEAWRDGQELNRLLPAGARVWLVGSAAVFYVDRPLHYTVVFNRDPWLARAAAGAGPAECVEWLRIQAVTHVVFSWAEIRRLAATYGFDPRVTPEWVAQLAAVGLKRVHAARSAGGVVLSEVYEVSAP